MSGEMNLQQDHQDIKPILNIESTHINLKVVAQDGTEVCFTVRKDSPLKKLMNLYCVHRSVELRTVVFLFDGQKFGAEQTPNELKMEDGDVIDAMLHQIGGAMGYF